MPRSEISWPFPENELIQDASVVARVDGHWAVLDLLEAGLTGLEAIERVLTELPLLDLCAMFTVNCDFSFLIRMAGGATRRFITNPRFEDDYTLPREVVSALGGAPVHASHLGDPGLLSDWGISPAMVIANGEFEGPGGWDELPVQVLRWLGLESLWGIGPEVGVFLDA